MLLRADIDQSLSPCSYQSRYGYAHSLARCLPSRSNDGLASRFRRSMDFMLAALGARAMRARVRADKSKYDVFGVVEKERNHDSTSCRSPGIKALGERRSIAPCRPLPAG
jgi:hypothetical protein